MSLKINDTLTFPFKTAVKLQPMVLLKFLTLIMNRIRCNKKIWPWIEDQGQQRFSSKIKKKYFTQSQYNKYYR